VNNKPLPAKSWAEERKLSRYSDTLFGHILFPVAVADEINAARLENRALKVAQEIAARENAQLCVLCVKSPEEADAAQEAVIERLRSQIEWNKSPQGVTEVLVESGDATRRMLELAYLHDLIVLDGGFNRQADRSRALSPKVYELVRQSTRPLFIVGVRDDEPTLTSVLLVHDTRRRFDEALFIAAYLAERWKPDLAVLPISNGRNTEEILTRIRDYLELHEINASFLEPVRPTNHLVEAMVDAAQTTACDLILLSGSGRGGDSRRSLSSEMVQGLLERWQKSVLLAT
jgi:nucleotide-binding universal stress UspA family protein